MKMRAFLFLAAAGLILASLMLLSTTAAHAQCGPNDPPCEPDKGEKEKKPTPIPPTEVPTNTPLVCVERTWYRDADADSYGIPSVSLSACSAPAGYAALLADCNDTNTAIHPGATDICGDGVDQDCDTMDATCAAAVAPLTAACVGPDCEPESPAAGGSPWIFGAGGLLLGILIGLLVPFKLGSFFDISPRGASQVREAAMRASGSPRAGSFFDSSVGKGTPGGGDTDPAGSFFDSRPEDLVGAKAPGPPQSPRDAASYPTDPEISPRDAASYPSDPELSPREAALNVREAALHAREAALHAREAALRSGSGTGTT